MATGSQVAAMQQKTSKYTGVSWDTSHGNWRAAMRDKNKVINLGGFSTEEDAAEAYNAAAAKHSPFEQKDAELDETTEEYFDAYDLQREKHASKLDDLIVRKVEAGTATNPDIVALHQQAAEEAADERQSTASADLDNRVREFANNPPRIEREKKRNRLTADEREAREADRDKAREQRWAEAQLAREAVRAHIEHDRELRRAAIEEERLHRKQAALAARTEEREVRKNQKPLTVPCHLPKGFDLKSLEKGHEWDCPTCDKNEDANIEPTQALHIFDESVQCVVCSDVFTIEELMKGNYLGWQGEEYDEGNDTENPDSTSGDGRRYIRQRGWIKLSIGQYGTCKWCGQSVEDQRIYRLGDGVAHASCPLPYVPTKEEAEAAAEAAAAVRDKKTTAAIYGGLFIAFFLVMAAVCLAVMTSWTFVAGFAGFVLSFVVLLTIALQVKQRYRPRPQRLDTSQIRTTSKFVGGPRKRSK
jgi:hypothetical protein